MAKSFRILTIEGEDYELPIATSSVPGIVQLTSTVDDQSTNNVVPTAKAVYDVVKASGGDLASHKEAASGGTEENPTYGHVSVYVSGTTLYIKGGPASK